MQNVTAFTEKCIMAYVFSYGTGVTVLKCVYHTMKACGGHGIVPQHSYPPALAAGASFLSEIFIYLF
jgi:hypothetical protein